MDDRIEVHPPFDVELNPDEVVKGSTMSERPKSESGPLKRRKTRWDTETTSNESAFKSNLDLQDIVKKMTGDDRCRHWSEMKCPNSVCLRFQMENKRTPRRHHKSLNVKIALIRKILYADRMCSTTTPTRVLDQMMDTLNFDFQDISTK